MKIESFDHIHIYSKTPEESAKFYIKNLGAKEIYQKEGDGGIKKFLTLAGQTIVLGPLPTDRSSSNSETRPSDKQEHHIGLDHFGIRVKNLNEAIEELRDKGVEILAEPIKGSAGISYAFISAPDGVVIELTAYGILPKIFLNYKKII